jgi:hypothetical protein
LSENNEQHSRWAFWGNLAAALWILGTTVVYFLRFTAAFYRDNQGAINELLEKLGLGFLVS